LSAAFGGGADIGDEHAIGFGVEAFPIQFHLRIIHDGIVGADVESEGGSGRCDGQARLCPKGGSCKEDE